MATLFGILEQEIFLQFQINYFFLSLDSKTRTQEAEQSKLFQKNNKIKEDTDEGDSRFKTKKKIKKGNEKRISI